MKRNSFFNFIVLLLVVIFAIGAVGCILKLDNDTADKKPTNSSSSSVDNPNSSTDEPIEESSQYIHFSFDDVSSSMKNLKNNSYDSLFDEPFLGRLKEYHDEYGAKFSLYVFADSLQNQTTAYQEEFKANSDWLKIGLHADYGGMNYSSFTYKDAVTSWTNFGANVLTLTGGLDCVDVVSRLHNFAGSEAALNAMCDYGAKGFLSADDSRSSYYLDSTANTYLKNNDYIKDSSNGLLFLKTDFRCEWIATSSGSSTHDNMYDELTYRNNLEKYENAYESIIVFTHEPYVYDGTALKDTISLVEDTCRFAKDNNIPFDFPQNRTYPSTENDIEGTFEKSPEIPEVPEESETPSANTLVLSSRELTVVDSFADITFSGGRWHSTTNFGTSGSYATHANHIIRVQGGETLHLEQNVSDGDISYYAIEITSISTLGEAIVSSTAPNWSEWQTGDLILQSDTKYILLTARFAAELSRFSATHFEELKTCFTIQQN